MPHRFRVYPVFHGGNNFKPHFIPGKLRIQIGPVCLKILSDPPEIILYLCPGFKQQRPDHLLPHRRNAAQSSESGSPRKVHKNRFRLIARMMSQRTNIRVKFLPVTFKNLISCVTAGFFQRHSIVSGDPGSVNGLCITRNIICAAQFFCKTGILQAFFAAKTVFYMNH